MSLIPRLILALILVLQSLPGVAVGRCAEITTSSGDSPTAEGDDESCPCCAKSDGAEATCARRDSASNCCCGTPRSERPQNPPTIPKSERTAFVAALVPALVGMMPPARGVRPARRDLIAVAPNRQGNSIQSVLCVWMM